MALPRFSGEASLYKTNALYRGLASFPQGPPSSAVVTAYIPGPDTQQRCSDCLSEPMQVRDVCLAKTAAEVIEACVGSFGFGCAAAIAAGYQQAAACEEGYLAAFGYCNIPAGLGELSGKCCPKVCGPPTPGVAGSGCCDHGETCKGLGMQENTRDGCCPVGQDCGEVCCAPGEKCCGQICCPQNYYCLDDHTCNEYPMFPPPPPPPPPPPTSGCYLFAGGSPCGTGGKCCYNFLQCCGVDANGLPICKT